MAELKQGRWVKVHEPGQANFVEHENVMDIVIGTGRRWRRLELHHRADGRRQLQGPAELGGQRAGYEKDQRKTRAEEARAKEKGG